jgi:hypothetical protein
MKSEIANGIDCIKNQYKLGSIESKKILKSNRLIIFFLNSY